MKDTVEIQSFELTSSVSSELISSQEAISSSASDTICLLKKKQEITFGIQIQRHAYNMWFVLAHKYITLQHNIRKNTIMTRKDK
jgi:hypothetical protein